MGHPVFGQSGLPGLANAFPGGVESFRQDTCVRGDGDEVGVADPAGQGVHVDVTGDACSSSLPEVDAEVESGGVVDLAQDALNSLGEGYHLLRFAGGQGSERIQVTVGNDEDVAGGVGEGVETEEAGGLACQDVGGLLGLLGGHAVGDRVVDRCDQVTEDAVAMMVAGFVGREARPGVEGCRNAGAGGVFGAADVVVAPRGPETIHRRSIQGGEVYRLRAGDGRWAAVDARRAAISGDFLSVNALTLRCVAYIL